jgi:hypothetical protein
MTEEAHKAIDIAQRMRDRNVELEKEIARLNEDNHARPL